MSVAALILLASTAAATPEAGSYRVIVDRVSVRKEVWGLFCSTPPGATQQSLGRKLEVTVDGNEWTASGAGRRFGTKSCEGTGLNKTLAVTARSQKGDAVVLSCRSRRVTRGTEETEHTVTAKDGTIRLKTVAKSYSRQQGEDCRSVLERVTVASFEPEKKPDAPAPPPPPPPTKEVDPCAEPGAPATLLVSPKLFDVKVGADPVCLEVTAKDANECAVKPGALTYGVDPKGLGTVDDKGCFSPSKKIKKDEAVAIVIKRGDVEAVATARVVPAAEARPKTTYKALAKTTKSKRAKKVLGEVSRGEIVLRPLKTDPPELEELEGDGFPILPVAGAGGLALLATLAGVGLAVRRRKNHVEATELQAQPVVTPKKGGGLVCPQCKFEFAVGDAAHCPFDNTELIPLERDARQTMFVPAAGGMVCPVCKTKYPTKARFCGHDRSPLIPDFGQFDDEGGAGGAS